jgi:hypothetical protein
MAGLMWIPIDAIIVAVAVFYFGMKLSKFIDHKYYNKLILLGCLLLVMYFAFQFVSLYKK